MREAICEIFVQTQDKSKSVRTGIQGSHRATTPTNNHKHIWCQHCQCTGFHPFDPSLTFAVNPHLASINSSNYTQQVFKHWMISLTELQTEFQAFLFLYSTSRHEAHGLSAHLSSDDDESKWSISIILCIIRFVSFNW